MRYILFYQTPYNTVKYITDEMQEETSLPYFKFCEWMFGEIYAQYRFPDSDKMRERLNCFDTICLYTDERVWEVVKAEKKQYDFDTLVKYNPDPEELKKQQEAKKPEVRAKNFIDSVSDWRRKNDGFNKYR